MAGVFIKYFGALLLVVGVVCNNGDGMENPETDAEIFASRDGLLNSIYNEYLTLSVYIFKRIEELCKKISDEDINTFIYKNKTSEASDAADTDTRETLLRKCVRRFQSRYDLDDRDEHLLLKYGLEDIRKDVERKYKELFEVTLRRISTEAAKQTDGMKSERVVK